jgi:hypothetical protein
LIVCHIQNPDGKNSENKGYYQVGKGFNTKYKTWNTWSEFLPIPGRFGAETQGAGVTVADFKEKGKHLIVFHIEDLDGGNCGYYRVGRNLDSSGNVPVENWSTPKQIPGLFGYETQGAGIAVADFKEKGKHLIIFHVDNPAGENKGYYRIGWNLDANGNVERWSGFKPVQGWFGSETQGASIAITDLNGNGSPDLIIFHIDNPDGENKGYYRIGWNLDINSGNVEWWSDVRNIPGWFGARTQGSGIATAYLSKADPYPRLIAFHLDNPKEKSSDNPGGGNEGYYRTGWILP